MLKKIHHLIRYFVFLGIVVFVGYLKRLHDDIFLALMGPIIYIAQALKELISKNITPLPSNEAVNAYGFLLPICLIYFGLVAYQLKQLWNERGKIKMIILFIFIGFLVYIHYISFKNFQIYLATDF